MKYTEKKALYESIMKEISKTVKRSLNESEDKYSNPNDEEYIHYYNGIYHNKYYDSLFDIMKSKDSSSLGKRVAMSLIEIWYNYINGDMLRKGEPGAYLDAMLDAIRYITSSKDVESMKEIVMKYHPSEINRH